MVAALARGSREPGQALTGAAISGVPLCEGRLHRVVKVGTFCCRSAKGLRWQRHLVIWLFDFVEPWQSQLLLQTTARL